MPLCYRCATGGFGRETSGGASANPAGHTYTLTELLAAFWRFAEKHHAGSTELKNYRTLIKRLRKAYGATLVNEFGPLRLKAFRDSLIAEKLSRSSINHATNRTRRIFKWGVENELVEPRILEGLRAVAGLRADLTAPLFQPREAEAWRRGTGSLCPMAWPCRSRHWR